MLANITINSIKKWYLISKRWKHFLKFKMSKTYKKHSPLIIHCTFQIFESLSSFHIILQKNELLTLWDYEHKFKFIVEYLFKWNSFKLIIIFRQRKQAKNKLFKFPWFPFSHHPWTAKNAKMLEASRERAKSINPCACRQW